METVAVAMDSTVFAAVGMGCFGTAVAFAERVAAGKTAAAVSDQCAKQRGFGNYSEDFAEVESAVSDLKTDSTSSKLGQRFEISVARMLAMQAAKMIWAAALALLPKDCRAISSPPTSSYRLRSQCHPNCPLKPESMSSVAVPACCLLLI